jgi:hypothetical protein
MCDAILPISFIRHFGEAVRLLGDTPRTVSMIRFRPFLPAAKP